MSCATGYKISIEPQGQVFVCKGTSEILVTIDDDKDILFDSERYLKYSSTAYNKSEECIGCEIEEFCFGVCTESQKRKINNIE